MVKKISLLLLCCFSINYSSCNFDLLKCAQNVVEFPLKISRTTEAPLKLFAIAGLMVGTIITLISFADVYTYSEFLSGSHNPFEMKVVKSKRREAILLVLLHFL